VSQPNRMQAPSNHSSRPSDAARGPVASGSRGENVDDTTGDHVLGFGGIGGHVRRSRVGLERVWALPLLDHHERVGAERRLELADVRGVRGRAVLDAALLGVHRWHIGADLAQDVSRMPDLAVMMAMTWIMGSSSGACSWSLLCCEFITPPQVIPATTLSRTAYQIGAKEIWRHGGPAPQHL